MNKLDSVVIVTCGLNRFAATIRFQNPKDDIIYTSRDKDMLYGFVERHVYRATRPPRRYEQRVRFTRGHGSRL